MLLTPLQINELVAIIEQFHVLFVVRQVGSDVLNKREAKILKDSGVAVSSLKKAGKVEHAFKFGILAQAIGDKRAKDLNYDKFKKFISSGNFAPLTKVEQFALNNLKYQAYSDIKYFGDRISKDVRDVILEESKKAVSYREGVKEFSSKIKERTQIWTRDFDRISDYVLHTAYDHGVAKSIEREHGEDAEVYKDVYKGACVNCQKLYLTNGLGSEPIIFKLSEILANGSNIGRKQAEWLAVIGATHPWCRCTVRYKKKDAVWNDEMKSFTGLRRVKHGIKRKSKAKVSITIKE